MSDYWMPETKWELVEALRQYYPTKEAEFKRMRKRQLYAIYFEVRERGLCAKVK